MARWLALATISLSLLLVPHVGRGADDPLRPDSPDDYELHKLLVDAIDQVEQNYVKPIDRRKLVEAAIRGVLGQLDDYSTYVAPESMSNFRTAVSHQFGGIGIQVGLELGQLTVISPLVGSPAYRAGMIAGDRILEIDGTPTKGLRLDDAVKLMKGENGTSVVLKVIHPGHDAPEEIKLTREVIHLETVLGDLRGDDDRWDYLMDDELRIAYVRLTGFGRDTAEDLRNVLNDLKNEKVAGMILDLRFNPGGLLSSAIQVADLFISEGKIVSTEGRNVKEQVWNAQKRGTFEGFPLVILVNHYSASASEIVAACLQDHQRAIVMGERSYGKGSVQRVIEMEHGQSALKLTTAGYHRPNGKNIDRHPGDTPEDEWGVKPNKGFELKLDDTETVALAHYRRERDMLWASKKDDQPNDDKATDGKVETGSEGKAEPGESANVPEEQEFVDRQLKMAMDYLRGELTKHLAETPKEKSPAEAAELAKASKETVPAQEAAKEKPTEPTASAVVK